jgi:hypothetical protein
MVSINLVLDIGLATYLRGDLDLTVQTDLAGLLGGPGRDTEKP